MVVDPLPGGDAVGEGGTHQLGVGHTLAAHGRLGLGLAHRAAAGRKVLRYGALKHSMGTVMSRHDESQ